MAPSDPFVPPSFPKLLVSLGLGVLVGVGLVLPAVRDDVTAAIVANPGPVGSVLLLGVVGLVGVTVGLFALYQLFWLVDR